MYKIVRKKELNDQVTLFDVYAPLIAKKALAGQFIIFRVREEGERIPLTIADYDREAGTVTIIFQKVGKSTIELGKLNEGDIILDFVGPLGMPTQLDGYKNVAVIGGGAGCAIAYPQAKALYNMGAKVTIIAGFRTSDLIILEDEMRAVSSKLVIMTDDGSNNNQGFVTNALESEMESGSNFDLVIAIGPLPMMKAVAEMTREKIKTIISMNSVMIDGTGMCGCCRVTYDGETKFACVHGPDFDAHKIDFDEAIMRSRMYRLEEQEAQEKHACNLTGEVKNG